MEINYLSNYSQLLLLTMIVMQSYTINSKRDFVASDCLNHHEDLVMGWKKALDMAVMKKHCA
jgi:hypothetical protein